MTNPYRLLPSIDRLLQDERLSHALATHARDLVVEAARDALVDARTAIGSGREAGDVVGVTLDRLDAALTLPLRSVINATGVVIHTNLGRAPLSEAALTAMAEVGGGYSNLEYDLDAGGRGSRHEHVTGLLRRLTGAEDALVVNNNAAAVMLALTGVAQGREVVISRGELVEIGGGFRIPDVLRQSGARLVEVGTTNRTYARDYTDATTPETAAYLWVHASNYRVIGFTHAPSLGELADAAHARSLPLVADLGSGTLLDTTRYGLMHETPVQEVVAAGADLVCFSGDKLLGGPQAGILVGSREVVGKLKRHPLTRAIRPDKATLAALGATLLHYVRGEAEREVPVWRMISATPAEIERRARDVLDGLQNWAEIELRGRLHDDATRRLYGPAWEIADGRSAIGGGSLPGETLPTRLLVSPPGLNVVRFGAILRGLQPPLVTRIERDRLVLDVRTVLPGQDSTIGMLLGRGLDALQGIAGATPSNGEASAHVDVANEVSVTSSSTRGVE